MNSEILRIYPNSIRVRGNSMFCIADADLRADSSRVLAVFGPEMDLFEGKQVSLQGRVYKLCPLNVENSKVIRRLFDFTNPVSYKGHNVTIGLGDRLGLASAGHIRLIRDLDIFPVLAQQSMRELNLTGRTYEDVLADVVWAVFREGYTKGYGADGDHLKTFDEVKNALDCGYTMITLDCSEHIRNDLFTADQTEINAQYLKLPADIKSSLENTYLDKSIRLNGDAYIGFTESELRRIALIYLPVIDHSIAVYERSLKGREIDFEVSIDETLCVTSPQAHFFAANELFRRGVEISGIAPRFTGEFQKGIDYIGDISGFERDFAIHAGIAARFGYRVSVHSGSDKFSIFPIVGRLSGGKYHLKTAGTSWLEAIRVIAANAPELYREIHAFALENLSEARKYYHITEDVSDIAEISDAADDALPGYLDQDSARQALHITYGLILSASARDGSPLFRDRISSALRTYEAEYYEALRKRLGRHLDALGAR